VISLALGIGASTAVFTVIYAALLHPYPYPAADRIVQITTQSLAGPGDPIYLNGTQIQTLRQSPVVESVLATDYQALTLTGQELPENVVTVSLISNAFQDLGVPPILGRGLWPSDAVDGQDPRPVALLSYRFWRKHDAFSALREKVRQARIKLKLAAEFPQHPVVQSCEPPCSDIGEDVVQVQGIPRRTSHPALTMEVGQSVHFPPELAPIDPEMAEQEFLHTTRY
jgi:hypothetical protein